MALMKNNNRRSFFPLLLAAIAAALLLPRKVVGKVVGAPKGSAHNSPADDADARALAALVKKAPQSVAYSPKQRRSSGAL